MDDKLIKIFGNVQDELKSAMGKFPPYNSAHEGWAVIREELDELWDEIKNDKEWDAEERQMKEALQVAVTAIRFIYDLDKRL